MRVACIQMRSGVEVAPNIASASDLIRQAADGGAVFIATPEMTNVMDIRRGEARHKLAFEAEDKALEAFRSLAAELSIWLLIGSLAIKLETDERLANRSYLIDPNGNITSRYDKIHMFDVDIEDGQTYRESASYRPGEYAVVAETPLAKIGMTICYDLRFSGLYRLLAQSGAQIMTCPAAFTKMTGEAHWHALLRARAIETGAFVMAPAQGGRHQDGRETYGHALIVSPWGEIIAEVAGDEPGYILADLDLRSVTEARQRIPAWARDEIYRLERRDKL